MRPHILLRVRTHDEMYCSGERLVSKCIASATFLVKMYCFECDCARFVLIRARSWSLIVLLLL